MARSNEVCLVVLLESFALLVLTLQCTNNPAIVSNAADQVRTFLILLSQLQM